MNEELINKYINDDCFNVFPKIEDKSIDLILCDLPYQMTANKWDVILPFDKLWAEYKRIIKDNGAIVLTASQPFTSALIMSNPKMFKYEWIWIKENGTGHLNAKFQPLKYHESVLVFCKNKPPYFPQGLILKDKPKFKKGRSNGSNYSRADKDSIQFYENYPKSILKFSRDTNKLHPTQKPLALFEYLIKTYSNPSTVI